jgi:hypothetical protein
LRYIILVLLDKKYTTSLKRRKISITVRNMPMAKLKCFIGKTRIY